MSKRAMTSVLLLALAAAALAAEKPERDPTQPFGRSAPGISVAADGPRFKLTAVVISPARRVAVLNGKPYLRGETVDGAEIVAIEHESVRLRESGADLVISLGRPPESAANVQGEQGP